MLDPASRHVSAGRRGDGPALLVSSPGGHLEELRILAPQLGVDMDTALWVTSATPQTESLLEGRRVHWTPPVGPRDLGKAVGAIPAAIALHRRVRPGVVVSTGAAAAAPHLVAASLARTETWFVESATRLHGPSMTGKLARALPGTRLFVQGEGWGDPRWTSRAGVFDAFEAVPRAWPSAGVDRVVVTLGTERFPFLAAVEAAEQVLDGCDVTWQTGSTVVSRGGRELTRWLPATDLRAACRDADVVVTHAGVGSVLVALDEGKVPVILPRSAARGEHVDEHQSEVAAMLAARGLAVVAAPGELTWDHIQRAHALQAGRVVPTGS